MVSLQSFATLAWGGQVAGEGGSGEGGSGGVLPGLGDARLIPSLTSCDIKSSWDSPLERWWVGCLLHKGLTRS